jgi:hypothetical protein
MDFDLWLVICLWSHKFVFHLVVEYIFSSKMFFLSPYEMAEICEFPFASLIAPPPLFFLLVFNLVLFFL